MWTPGEPYVYCINTAFYEAATEHVQCPSSNTKTLLHCLLRAMLYGNVYALSYYFKYPQNVVRPIIINARIGSCLFEFSNVFIGGTIKLVKNQFFVLPLHQRSF